MKKFIFVLVLFILTSIISGCGLIDRMANEIQKEQQEKLMQQVLEQEKQSLEAFDKIFNGDVTSRMTITQEGKSYTVIIDDSSFFDVPREEYAYIFSDITIENKIIYNQNDLIITTTGLDLTHTSGPALNIRIQNNSKTDYSLVTKYASINDVMIDTNFSVDVPSKSDINSRISFSHHELRKSNITILSKLEFSFGLSSPSSSDEFILSDPITILTSNESDLRHSFEDSGIKLTNNDSLTIICKRIKYTKDTHTVEIDFFFENHLPNNIKIIPIEVLVNNLEVEPKPIFSSEIAGNKRIIDTVTFAGEDLDTIEITNLDFAFTFRVEDAQTGEEILTLTVY